MAFFAAGKLFPRRDRSPTMVPQALGALQKATGGRVQKIARISRGFYISECLEFRP
jgi:magnesium-protoporphyrin O-methyltransferase